MDFSYEESNADGCEIEDLVDKKKLTNLRHRKKRSVFALFL